MGDGGLRARSFPRRCTIQALALVLCLAGCSGPAAVRKDLVQAATDATAAVRSGQLALELLQQGRSTRSHADTVFVDMNRQLTSTLKTVTDLSLDDPTQAPDRDQVLGAVNAAVQAVLSGRDCLRTKTSCAGAADQLRRADDLLAAAEQKLRSQR